MSVIVEPPASFPPTSHTLAPFNALKQGVVFLGGLRHTLYLFCPVDKFRENLLFFGPRGELSEDTLRGHGGPNGEPFLEHMGVIRWPNWDTIGGPLAPP